MNPELEAAALAIARAWRLSADLTRTRRPSDLEQVQAGVRHELSRALDALADAVGMNPRDMHDSVLTDQPEVQELVLKRIAESPCADSTIQGDLGLDPLRERLARGALVDAGLIQPVNVVASAFDGLEWTAWGPTQLGRKVAAQGENPQVTDQIGDQLPLL